MATLLLFGSGPSSTSLPEGCRVSFGISFMFLRILMRNTSILRMSDKHSLQTHVSCLRSIQATEIVTIWTGPRRSTYTGSYDMALATPTCQRARISTHYHLEGLKAIILALRSFDHMLRCVSRLIHKYPLRACGENIQQLSASVNTLKSFFFTTLQFNTSAPYSLLLQRLQNASPVLHPRSPVGFFHLCRTGTVQWYL